MTGEEFETDEGTAVTVAGLPFILISSIVSSSHKKDGINCVNTLAGCCGIALSALNWQPPSSQRRSKDVPADQTVLSLRLSSYLSLSLSVCMCVSVGLLSYSLRGRRRRGGRGRERRLTLERRREEEKCGPAEKKKLVEKVGDIKKRRQRRRRRRHYITAPVLINQPQQKHMLIDIFMYMQIYHSGGPRDGGNPEMPASLSIYIHSRNTTYTAHTHTV